MLTPVQFTKSYRQYNAHEVAAFSPDVAEDLVKGGFAKAVKSDAGKAVQTGTNTQAKTVVTK